jgi:4-alpha-glucanotransferase
MSDNHQPTSLSPFPPGNLWRTLKRPGRESGEAAPALLSLAWSSVAALALAPLQDLLNLGAEARMNVPGRAEGNWRWRCTQDMLAAPALQRLRDLTESSNRSPLRQDKQFSPSTTEVTS